MRAVMWDGRGRRVAMVGRGHRAMFSRRRKWVYFLEALRMLKIDEVVREGLPSSCHPITCESPLEHLVSECKDFRRGIDALDGIS